MKVFPGQEGGDGDFALWEGFCCSLCDSLDGISHPLLLCSQVVGSCVNDYVAGAAEL